MLRRVAIALISCLLTVGLAIVVGAQPSVQPNPQPNTPPTVQPNPQPSALPTAQPEVSPSDIQFKRTNRAETVLEKVARSGVLTAGTRTDASPFAYIDAQGNWVGFAIELLRLIQAGMQDRLQRPIQLQLVETNVADWASKLERDEIDLVCGSTSITTSRNLRADFSVGYFRTGTQFLVKKDHLLTPPELQIGVVRGASNEHPIETQLRLAKLTRFADRAEGLTALVAGRIDALASDGILLEGLRQTLPNAEMFEIIPTQPFSLEIYGCALPQNDTTFKALVNRELITFMWNVLNNDSLAVATFDTWFGSEGIAPVDRAQILGFFAETIASYEQNSGNSN
ncbi:MAG: amino acid ABC transporter substrate-binding protein [Oscillatoriophycideae cyanobacterium NC_groundwater_1537_Pr4_S-0.65um_50_18]|nr:amino acid ABC transporter substrate-binding protein [Oscillatoriophycideae cyanobacterium NC_groundwater_1537_Pr4_S-0.65um_50_18]